MSGDTLTYDMAMMPEGAPQIFVKRDWLNLQDQQNGNYAGNQLTIDTSQLANSNKYMDYRNSYLSVPMIMAATAVADASGSSFLSTCDGPNIATGTVNQNIYNCFSLKNWFGSIVHSMILDYAGTTIIQQTSLCGLWSTFRLMTTLSMADVETLGPTIGFYPDSSNFSSVVDLSGGYSGIGVCNNRKDVIQHTPSQLTETSNPGIYERWSKMMILAAQGAGGEGEAFSALSSPTQMDAVYRSRVISATNGAANAVTGGATVGVCFQIQAFIYLRHLHSFFGQIPLLKGVFFRLTLNLNQPVVVVENVDANVQAGAGKMRISSIVSPLGGVSPIMIASNLAWKTIITKDEETTTAGPVAEVCVPYGPIPDGKKRATLSRVATHSCRVTLNVGQTIIDSTQRQAMTTAGLGQTGGLGTAVFLNVPAFTFNPSFESAYLSKPTKTIVYTDIYQFTTAINPSGQFQYLVTNGISNIKSVLVIPFNPEIASNAKYPPFWSPFDTAGGGTTAPCPSLTNFNVVVAGQNMIYNTVQRSFEEFNNQLYGCNAVNAGLTDGMTSSLINYWDFLQLYGYYYVNCARQLPIDEAVPKSVQIQGTNNTQKSLQFYVFVEYGVQVNVDVLTGARV